MFVLLPMGIAATIAAARGLTVFDNAAPQRVLPVEDRFGSNIAIGCLAPVTM